MYVLVVVKKRENLALLGFDLLSLVWTQNNTTERERERERQCCRESRVWVGFLSALLCWLLVAWLFNTRKKDMDKEREKS